MTFIAFQPKNLNEQVVEAIGKRIVAGYYSEGGKLPVEMQLCEEYGVSRPVMREAIKILMAKGMLSSKPKIGTIIKEKKFWNLLDSDVLSWTIRLLPEQDFLDMLFDLRMAIEPHSAELAAKNSTKEDIEIIASAYNDMEKAESPAQLTDPDLRFHQAIMDATHNDLLSCIGHTLHNALAESIQLTSRHPNTHELSLPRHKTLFTAIKNADPVAAREAATKLLIDSHDDFKNLSE